IGHHDAPTRWLIDHPQLSRTNLCELSRTHCDRCLPLATFSTGTHVEVQVDPVLHRLRFGNSLKEHPGSLARWVDDCCLVIAILFRHSDRIGEGIPGFESRWRRLDDIAESCGPEVRQLRRI